MPEVVRRAAFSGHTSLECFFAQSSGPARAPVQSALNQLENKVRPGATPNDLRRVTDRRARGASGCRTAPRGSQTYSRKAQPLQARAGVRCKYRQRPRPNKGSVRTRATPCWDPFNLAKATLPCESPIVPRHGASAQAAERGDDSSADSSAQSLESKTAPGTCQHTQYV